MTDENWSLADHFQGNSYDELADEKEQLRTDADFADFEEGAAMGSQPFGISGQPDEAPKSDGQSQPMQSAFAFIPVGDLKYRAPEYIIGDLFETDKAT
jgi:hypothetical protein